MRRKILVKIEDYKRYLLENNTNKLDSKNIIYTSGSLPKFITDKINEEEIFNGIETKYDIQNKSSDKCLIIFKSKSDIEYRFDILKEPNTKIWHLAFSLSSSVFGNNYHDKTGKKEPFDVFNRIIWILKDITHELDVDEYCIGATGDDSKDNIYQYMMRLVSGWEKRNTTQYPLGWALYFKL